MNAILSEKEARFAAAYVANGGNATKTAIAAGYSHHTAKQAGSRLMHRPRVQAEIARLGGINADILFGRAKPENTKAAGKAGPAVGSAVRGEVVTLGAPEPEGHVRRPEAGSDEDEVPVASLTPAWMVARLMRIAMTCLGEMERSRVKIVTKTDADGTTVVSAVQFKVREFDAAGAVSAISQLAKITGVQVPLAASTDEHDVSKIPGRAKHEAAMSAFARMAEEIRQREAENVKARSNGHAKPNGTNGQVNGNGNGKPH